MSALSDVQPNSSGQLRHVKKVCQDLVSEQDSRVLAVGIGSYAPGETPKSKRLQKSVQRR
eukprot:4271300-Amphidinium_carterae.1